MEFSLNEDLNKTTAGSANDQEAAENIQQQIADALGVDPSRIDGVELSPG